MNNIVTASKDYSEGDTVEISNVLHVREKTSDRDLFTVNGIRTIAEGNALVYQHSTDPNLGYRYVPSSAKMTPEIKPELTPARLIFEALKDINKGEELTINFDNSNINDERCSHACIKERLAND